MSSCPFCQNPLAANDVTAARCPACGRALTPVAAPAGPGEGETTVVPGDEAQRLAQTLQPGEIAVAGVATPSDDRLAETLQPGAVPEQPGHGTANERQVLETLNVAGPPPESSIPEQLAFSVRPAAPAGDAEKEPIEGRLPSGTLQVPGLALEEKTEIAKTLDSGTLQVPPVAPEEQSGIAKTLDSASLRPDLHPTPEDAVARTLDSGSLGVAPQSPPENGVARTLDSATAGIAGPTPTPGGEIQRTLDSGKLPGMLPPVGPGDASQTLVSDSARARAAAQSDERLAETYGSGKLPSDVAREMLKLWSGKFGSDASPRQSIKGEAQSIEAMSRLVIPQRVVVEAKDAQLHPGDYELMRQLAKGGQGVIHTARQASINRVVALKKVLPHLADKKEFRENFLQEAVTTGKLEHPNIIPIYDVCRDEAGQPFYSMKWVQGKSWQHVLREKSEAENLEVLMKVSDAIGFAHSRDIIHRDLKPENIMIGEFGEVLVMDWGLAIAADRVGDAKGIIGTPAYMAPEQARGTNITLATDIYLLGAMLFEIVTGTPPHGGKTINECVMAALNNDLVATTRTGELVDIARRAMATRPTDRYSNVAEFQKALREYQSHAQSVLLSTRADADLERARQSDDYETYSRAIFGFQEALSLWQGNDRAATGTGEGTLAYAQSALRKGDFDLGLSLLNAEDPHHAPLVRQLRKAQSDRNAREQRNRALKRIGMALAACLFVVITVAFFWIRSEKAKADEATLVAVAEKKNAEAEKKNADAERDKAVKAQALEAQQRLAAQESETKARQSAEAAIAAQKKEEAAKKEAVRLAGEEAKARQAAETARQEADRQKALAQTEQKKAEVAAKEQEYQAYIAKVGLAATKIDENAFDSALAILNSCPVEHRGWEWGRLMHLCSQHIQSVDAQQPIEAVAYSPDGKRFVTGGWGGTARIWDAASGKQLLEIPTGGEYVFAAAFSPDGTQLALGTNAQPQYLRIWDANTGKPLRTLGTPQQGHSDAVLSVAWSKNGKQLLSSSYDHKAILWDLASSQPPRILHRHDWWVWSAAFSPDEKYIVTASQDGSCLVWSAADGTVLHRFAGDGGPVYAAVFSPKERLVASAGYDKRIHVWDPLASRAYDPQPQSGRSIKTVSFSADSPRPGLNDFALAGHTAGVRSLRFSTDGRLLLSAGNDNTVRVWDMEGKRLMKTMRGHGGRVSAAVFAPRGQQVLSGGYDQRAKIWDLAGYEEVRVLQGNVLDEHEDAVLGAAFSADGRRIVTASRDRTARIWDAASGKSLQRLREGHRYLASSVAFFAGGRRLLTAAMDNTTRIWDVGSGSELVNFEGTGVWAAVAVSHDGKSVITGSDDRGAKLWDADSGKLVQTFQLEQKKAAQVMAVAFSPDDRLVATGDEAGQCCLWEVATGKLRWQNSRHAGEINAMAFVPGSPHLLTASNDYTVFSWHVDSGQLDMPRILKHPGPVTSMDVSSDGRWVATTCEDGNVRVWERAGAQELARASIGQPGRLIKAVRFAHDNRGLAAVEIVQEPAQPSGPARPQPLADQTHQIRFWSLRGTPLTLQEEKTADGRPVLAFPGREMPWGLAFAPDGSRVAVAIRNEARLFQVQPGSSASELIHFSPTGAMASAQFSPDGNRVVTGSWDRGAQIWEVKSGRGVLKLRGHSGLVNATTFSSDGGRIVTASSDKTAIIWDAATGKPLVTLRGHQERVTAATFSPDGQLVLTASADKTARIWAAASGKLLRALEGHTQGVVAAAFSRDGTRVITGSEDTSARVWDTATAKALGLLEGHSSTVSAVAFSPDGRRAITGSQDNTAKIWEVAKLRKDSDLIEGKELLTLRGQSQDLTAVALSPDGQNALTGSRDGTVYIWHAVNWAK